jgi:hypothetical protein
MSITLQGLEGEKIARLILKEKFKVNNIFQADWLVKKDNKWYVIEVKYKELFKPPPFWGQGLDIRQVKARLEFYKDTGIKCLFLIITKPNNEIYWQWLDVLNKTEYIDTKNKIRIYNIKEFCKLKN